MRTTYDKYPLSSLVAPPWYTFKYSMTSARVLIGLKDSKMIMKVLLSYERLLSNVFCDVTTLQRLHF